MLDPTVVGAAFANDCECSHHFLEHLIPFDIHTLRAAYHGLCTREKQKECIQSQARGMKLFSLSHTSLIYMYFIYFFSDPPRFICTHDRGIGFRLAHTGRQGFCSN